MPHFYLQFVLYTSYRLSESFTVILWLPVYPIATLAVRILFDRFVWNYSFRGEVFVGSTLLCCLVSI